MNHTQPHAVVSAQEVVGQHLCRRANGGKLTPAEEREVVGVGGRERQVMSRGDDGESVDLAQLGDEIKHPKLLAQIE